MFGLSSRTKIIAGILTALLGGGAVSYLVFSPVDDAVHWDTEISGDPLNVDAIEQAFERLGYDFDQVKIGQAAVPRVLVRTMPGDMDQVAEVEHRKALFLGAVLPVVLAVNEQLVREHETVLRMATKFRAGEALNLREKFDLQRLAKAYEITSDDDGQNVTDLSDAAIVEELVLRAAPIPVSLALAQAAEESAWGLSRFAIEGNALYGQWVWNDDAGIIPKGRRTGHGHSIQAFENIYESTLSYAQNLNTHPAYKRFRRMRAYMITSSGRMDSASLAGALTRYSGRGQAYVESLRTIMRVNELSALDRARLTGA